MILMPAGRPAKNWTDKEIKLFKSLCAALNTEQDICEVMGLTDKTLVLLINRHLYLDIRGEEKPKKKDQPIDFSEAYKKYSAAGRVSLRRKLTEKAMKGSTPELIFLAKNQLGMSDNPNAAQSENVRVIINR